VTRLPQRPILNADDYAMTGGVSDAIEDLARAGRLSATSVMTSMPVWPERASRLRELRKQIATGLHLNLTVGRASTASATLAPKGTFPTLPRLILASVTRRLDSTDVRTEIAHQLDLFERHLGFPPDHIDGHQHVHTLPVIRSVLIDEINRRYPARPPLFRLPDNAATRLPARLSAGLKAGVVATLSAGTARDLARAPIPHNTRFSGFSSFDIGVDYAAEIDRELRRAEPAPGETSIVMCHPGFPDDALAGLDPITTRRRQEFEALMTMPELPDRIWHPDRPADGSAIDWSHHP